MSILDNLKQTAINILAPGLGDRINALMSSEERFKQEVYGNNPTALRSRTWYRLASERGENTGYQYVCTEGQVYTFVDVMEALRDHVCPNCKDKMDLLKFVGIDPKEVHPTQWKSIIDSKLQMRPSLRRAATPGAVMIGDCGDCGTPNSPREGWQGELPRGADGSWV
jgi:hypothetical protein